MKTEPTYPATSLLSFVHRVAGIKALAGVRKALKHPPSGAQMHMEHMKEVNLQHSVNVKTKAINSKTIRDHSE